MIASTFRFNGNKKAANKYFELGLQEVFKNIQETVTKDYPVSIFYAFKQAEADNDKGSIEGALVSTGWETMLQGLLDAGFLIVGTWPLRTERDQGLKTGTNALASSIVLICRLCPSDAPIINQRDFMSLLKHEIPQALRQLQQGNIAPVDLAQAAIGPGMAIFSRYKAVLEADGSPMRVRAALALINQAMDEYLAEQEGEYDGDTRWALAWYEQYSHEQGPYGVAETLSTAKNTSVEGLVHAGFLEARSGKVRLLRRDELDPDWNPQKDKTPHRLGSRPAPHSQLDKEGRTGRRPATGAVGCFGRKTPAIWPTGCTPSASARSGPRKRWPTTCWWSPGRGSRNRCIKGQGRRPLL